jgi:regulatory protein
MSTDKLKEAKRKAGMYCAYQERTQQEVRNKLYELGLYKDDVEYILAELITENFVNEERYARAFAGGKFRIKRWGRMKISYALKQKNISSYCIERAMEEIPEDEYIEIIRKLIDIKSASLSGDPFVIKKKIAAHLIGKGFESEKVWPILNEQLKFN